MARRGRTGLALCAALLLAGACNPASRHRTLSLFFDGVPAPPTAEEIAAAKAAAASPLKPMRAPLFLEHGPYAARLCTSCHESTASNTFVAPKQELCGQCHGFGKAKKTVHDPFDSNDCMDCHDPHSGRTPGILVADVVAVCHACHEQATLEGPPEHADAKRACTDCHDPHQSDRESLLR